MFLDTVKDVTFQYNWLCHAYCLMENHTICSLIHPMEIFR